MEFAVKTEQFEGPLDLLIELIEKRKLLVNDFSIAHVTDDYLAYVATLESRSLKEAAQFVSLAATLLLIKSRSLLPVFEVTKDEEEAIDDLEERLRIYQIYRGGARVLARRFGSGVLYPRPYLPDRTPVFSPDALCTRTSLRDAIARVITDLPRVVSLPQVRVKPAVSLEDMMARLHTRLERQMKLRFREFTHGVTEPATVIVSFLAVLEMVRQGHVDAQQTVRFGDIDIAREASSGVPRYG